MPKITTIIPIVLLVVGTLGLVAGEFVFGWGRTATLVFAGMNMLGLFSLIYVAGVAQKKRDEQAKTGQAKK